VNDVAEKQEDDGKPKGSSEEKRSPTDLDGPDSNEHLYETFGSEEDDPLRPVFQGDVFNGITLSGYDSGDHDVVILVGHPCSLRKGAPLRKRLQAAAVKTHTSVAPAEWRTGHKQVFPLPALDGVKATAGNLREIGVVTRDQVETASRVATLTDRGILLLQQRMVWTLARTVVRLDTFAEFNAPQLIERELLEYWNEQLCEKCSPADLNDALAGAAQQFEDYMLEDDRRKLLEQPDRRAEVRRAVWKEAERRAQNN
jgi:hypothetical protein